MMRIPYELVGLVAAILLGARYLFLGDASPRSKAAVAVAVGSSLVIWWCVPKWIVVAILLQVGVSLFVLLYLKLNPYAS